MENIKNISAIVNHENILWFASEEFNALFRYDLENKRTEFKGNFPGEGLKAQSLYSELALYGHQIVFAPAFAGQIAIYDIEEERFITLNLPEQTNAMAIRCTGRKFGAVIVHNQDALFVGKGIPVILKLDMKTYGMQEYFLPGYTGKIEDCYNQSYFFIDKVVLGDSIFLPLGNKILEWNMIDGSSALHEIGKPENRYITLCYDGARMWLTDFQDGIYVWDMADGHLERVDRFPDGFRALHAQHNFIRSFYYHGSVYFIPGTFSHILKADVTNHRLSKVDWIGRLDEKIIIDRFQSQVLNPVGETKSYGLLAFSDLDESLMMIRDHHAEPVPIHYPDDFLPEHYLADLSDVTEKNGGCIPESGKWDLKYFIREYIDQQGGEATGPPHGGCGAAIYQTIRGMRDHAGN